MPRYAGPGARSPVGSCGGCAWLQPWPVWGRRRCCRPHWRTALELLADWMFHSTMTPAEFEREKGVVQRELEQDLDNPEQMLAQTAMETRFQVHPARYPVIGYKELVQKVSRDDLLTYYQRMYTPNNMLLVVVGDVQTATALEHIRATFGTGQRRPLPAISLPEEPTQLGKR